MTRRKLILYIAASLDGYIAKPNDDLSFLNRVHREGEDYGYSEFIQSVDTVIVGKKTYDWVMNRIPEFPHADKETYIITRTEQPDEGNLRFYTGGLTELVTRLKAEENRKNIFCDGGADVINELLKHHLIDEMIISVIPFLVGDGVRLFKDGRPEEDLKLLTSKAFESGLMQLHYEVVRM